MKQRTEEWFSERLGCVTASRISSLMALDRSGNGSATRAAYMNELIEERITGRRAPGFSSQHMKWGIHNESLARQAYTTRTKNRVELVGFIPHP